MAYTHSERLSALDASFLALEDENVHMHVAAVGMFETGPLSTPDGGLDIGRIRAFAGDALRRSPRFRQKLGRIALFDHPVWVDDPRFNLDYHVRHTALPVPGDVRQLKRLAGRILSQQLDRGKPLWEMWFVEGLEEGRFAVVTKVHHCMVDGIAGMDLLAALLRPEPDPRPREASGAWLPRPAPGPLRLLAGELGRRAALPGRLLGAAGSALAAPGRSLRTASEAAQGLREALAMGLHSASPTPLNQPIGPHRRFDWLRMDLEAVREVKARLGGTLNDVVLAMVSGALRRFLERRGVRVADLALRALVPVSVRSRAERGRPGNRVSFLMAPLAVDEADPRERVRRTLATMRSLKQSKEAVGAEVIEQLADWTTAALFVEYARLGARTRAYNLVVTNVPGPQRPAYLLGARMLEIYPLVPLYVDQALGIALLSYAGGLHWGFNADWDALPDLHDLVEAVQLELETLRKL